MRYSSIRDRLLLAAVFSAPFVSPSAGRAQILAPNLIYTSVQSCRVFDTRSAANGTNGRLVHGVAQTFNVVGGNVTATTFTGQGGHDGGCGIPGFTTAGGVGAPFPQVQAVMLNFVAVGAAGGGDLAGWPTDHPQPRSSILNYANAANLGYLNLANAVVLPLRQDSQGADISIEAEVSDTDVVADVMGYFSSGSPTQGFDNLFLGAGTGNPGATGFANTVVGNGSLKAAMSGNANTALGSSSLVANSGAANTAVGAYVLKANTTGAGNTGIGSDALVLSTSGQLNTAAGAGTLQSNTTGSLNTAVGASALQDNTTGSNNVCLGPGTCLMNTAGNGNVFVGPNAGMKSTGGLNIGLGSLAGWQILTGTNNIDIGNPAPGDESDVIRIGQSQTAAFLAGVNGATSAGGTAVMVNGAGKLGTTTSSLRFKEDVEDMGEASDLLMRLRPVTFHYKPACDDGSRLLQYGLIAEEAAAVSPGLVQTDPEGRPLAVRYHFVNAMLLNEVQKLHAGSAEQRSEIANLVARLDEAQRQVEAQEVRLGRQAAEAARQRAWIAALEARLARLEGLAAASR
jgi:hypothetical protein